MYTMFASYLIGSGWEKLLESVKLFKSLYYIYFQYSQSAKSSILHNFLGNHLIQINFPQVIVIFLVFFCCLFCYFCYFYRVLYSFIFLINDGDNGDNKY